MKKLKLAELEVTSFATTDSAPELRGTVRAHADGIGGVLIGEPQMPNVSEIRCGPTGLALGCTVGCSYVTMCNAGCPTGFSDCFCLPAPTVIPAIPTDDITRGTFTGEIVAG